MSRFLIDEVKDRLDIVEVIGGYVALKRSGNSYRALCPFHNEKTPSFHVFPDTGTWRCFGACGDGGDVINFVQKRESLDFPEAYRMLAQRAGVDIDQNRDPEATSRLNRLRDVNHLAATFFHHQLKNSAAGESARAYLRRREITDETIQQFQIGFVPEGWDNLITYMRSREYELDDLEAAGLIIRREDGGGYDRFRDRVIIPICDSQGRVIGFGGRILGDGEPKYLNSPQTALFDKSRVVFAYDHARRSIISQDQVVLVEGYMDVISAHQRGFKNVVAAMGTSITPQQLKVLSGKTQKFVFALDADAAGINATLRSIHVVRETFASAAVPVPTAGGRFRHEPRLAAVVKIAAMPDGMDPDDVLRKDPSMWQRLIDGAKPLVDYYFEQAASEEDLSTAHGKADFVKRLLPIINEIDDIIERKHYVARLATLSGVTEREIDQQLEIYAQSLSRARKRAVAVPKPVGPPSNSEEPPFLWQDEPETPTHARPSRAATSRDQQIEEHILAYLVIRTDLLIWADGELATIRLDPIDTVDFQHAANRAIFDAQQEFLYSDAVASSSDLSQHLDPSLLPHFESIWQQAQNCRELRDEQLRKDLVDSVLRLRLRRVVQDTLKLEQLIREADDKQDLRSHLGHLGQKSREMQTLTKVIASRSHSSRWMNGNQLYAT